MSESLEKRMGRIESLIQENNERQKEILILLQGNSINKADDGLVGEVMGLKKDVAMFKRYKTTIIGMISGLSLGSGYALSDILSKVFTKH